MKRKILVKLLLISSECVFSQNYNLICNGNFENPVIFSSPGMLPVSSLSCWQTSAQDQIVELWQSGFYSVPAYSGNQFLELNANYVSTIYQDFYASPGSILEISFAHRGRAGVDTMKIEFGPPGGPYNDLGSFADNNTSWGYYTVYTSVPNSGNQFRIRFISVYATLQIPSVGNFLDSVIVQYSKTGILERASQQKLSAFPNPFSKSITVLLAESSGLPVHFTIMDLHGKTVYNSKHIPNGSGFIHLEFPALQNGFYLLKAECEGAVFHQKIVRLD